MRMTSEFLAYALRKKIQVLLTITTSFSRRSQL